MPWARRVIVGASSQPGPLRVVPGLVGAGAASSFARRASAIAPGPPNPRTGWRSTPAPKSPPAAILVRGCRRSGEDRHALRVDQAHAARVATILHRASVLRRIAESAWDGSFGGRICSSLLVLCTRCVFGRRMNRIPARSAANSIISTVRWRRGRWRTIDLHHLQQRPRKAIKGEWPRTGPCGQPHAGSWNRRWRSGSDIGFGLPAHELFPDGEGFALDWTIPTSSRTGDTSLDQQSTDLPPVLKEPQSPPPTSGLPLPPSLTIHPWHLFQIPPPSSQPPLNNPPTDSPPPCRH